MIFSERLEMEKAYKEYLKQNPTVADTPFTVITFMDRYFKDENKEVNDLKQKYEEASKLQRELLQQYALYFKSFGCENFEEFKELIALAYISNDDKEMIDNAKHQGYMECEKQLAEKDKEIEKLKNFKRDINNALYMDAYDERCGVDSIVLYTALKKDIRRILNEFDQIEGENK